jgi:hypothetical protein
MKRTASIFSGLSVLAIASVAFAVPLQSSWEMQRIQFDAGIVAQRSQNILASISSGSRGFGHGDRNAKSLQAVRELAQSAQKLQRQGFRATPRSLLQKVERLEQRFGEAQRELGHLRQSGWVQADLNEIGRCLAEIGAIARRIAIAPMPAAQPTVTYTPYAQATVTYTPYPQPTQPTTVYTTPGASVSWYQAQ